MSEIILFNRTETPEVGGGHLPPSQVLGYQLTLFGPRGTEYARHITAGPPIFLEDAASLDGKIQPLKKITGPLPGSLRSKNIRVKNGIKNIRQLIFATLKNYRISSYSFRPLIVSAPLCTVTFGLMYCDL